MMEISVFFPIFGFINQVDKKVFTIMEKNLVGMYGYYGCYARK